MQYTGGPCSTQGAHSVHRGPMQYTGGPCSTQGAHVEMILLGVCEAIIDRKFIFL